MVECNRKDFLYRHLKTAAATKRIVAKPNNGWTRISSGLQPTRTATINVSKPAKTKATANEKQSTNSSAASNASTGTSGSARRLTDA